MYFEKSHLHFAQLPVIFLVAGIHSASNASTSTATVTANIVRTISITNLNNMVFGDISASSSSGTVIVNASGSRSATGGATINTAVSGGPATFEVIGDTNAVYSISLPSAVTLTTPGGDTILVNGFTSNPDTGSALLDASGKQTISVGSALNTSAFQPFGAYSGIMSVTVNYN